LWSGYGSIDRYALKGGERDSVIVKHVRFPDEDDSAHPRGWNTDLSDQRKHRSYEVETNWYQHWATRCDASCRVPECLAIEHHDDEVLILLEDLAGSGFREARYRASEQQILGCLTWLAHFHAEFMGETPDDLWPVGSYWHLATRPDELAAMEATGDHAALRDAAPAIDAMLSGARFQTLVHGDAKLANFCFSQNGRRVAAVDFQYVGGGCGMKDVAYFLGSCLNDREHGSHEAMLLDHYFAVLSGSLAGRGRDIDTAALECEWRALMPVAQADFYRFLVGWMPTHWKINDYNKRVALQVAQSLR